MSFRLEKFNSAVKRELGKIIHRELEFGNSIVTLMEAQSSEKMGSIRISVAAFPQENMPRVLGVLNNHRGLLKKKLNDRFDFGRVPELVFVAQKGAQNVERVEELLRDIPSEK